MFTKAKRKIKGVTSIILSLCLVISLNLSYAPAVFASGSVWDYGYTASTQQFTTPATGTYRLEVWGAQGGDVSAYSYNSVGGYGGYASGTVFLTQGEIVYITVGGQGSSGVYGSAPGGFNGGGSSWYYAGGGGGATDMRIGGSDIDSRVIVAGGGGGARGYANGGAGGGSTGSSGDGSIDNGAGQANYNTPIYSYAEDVTYYGGSFGVGGNGEEFGGYGGGGAGGGGYYGGRAGGPWTTPAMTNGAGGGGSGYIGGVTNGTMSSGVQSGNGYARITALDITPNPPIITTSRGSWGKNDVTFTLSTGADNGDTIDHMEWMVDNAGGTTAVPWTRYTGEVDLSQYPLGEGGHWIYARSVDLNGNMSDVSFDTNVTGSYKSWFGIDTSKPYTPQINLSRTGWGQNSVTFTLTNLGDAVSGGLSYYSIDGGNWITYGDGSSNAGTIMLSNDGWHTINAEFVDWAGNISDIATASVGIDATPPTLNVSESPSSWTNQNITLTVTATDNEILQAIQLPNGNWVNSNSVNYVVSQNGNYSFSAQDEAGNLATKTFSVTNIDTTPPSSPIITANEQWTNALSVPVIITPGSDTQSGVNRTEYSLSGATNQDWTTYNGVFDIVNEGMTTVSVRTLDNVGNSSDICQADVRIDRTSPTNTSITILPKGK